MIWGRTPPVRQHPTNCDRAQTRREHSNRNVDGGDEPEGEQIQRFVAVLALGRIIVRLVLLVDPERTDYEPAEHETVDQLLRRRLS